MDSFKEPRVLSKCFTRFKLRNYSKDHLNQNGILPVGKMPKMILSLYYTPASYCCYYAGVAIGTISLNYTIDNLQLQVREIASPTLTNLMTSSTMLWCAREW
jgi:hypothetical protein